MATPEAAAGRARMFCKGGPGKNHQARLPGGLVGLEGLSFILSRTEPWNTVYTHLGPTSPPRAFPRNVSIVLVFRLTSGSWNTSPCTASIRGQIQKPGSVLPILAEYF
jgi:hypothetical protein